MLRPGATARAGASGGVASASAATRSPAGTAHESRGVAGSSAPTSSTATTSSALGSRCRYWAKASSASRNSRFTLADFGLLASSRRATTTPSARTSANRRSRAVGASGKVAGMGRLTEVDTCIYPRARTKSRGCRENCSVFVSAGFRRGCSSGKRCFASRDRQGVASWFSGGRSQCCLHLRRAEFRRVSQILHAGGVADCSQG